MTTRDPRGGYRAPGRPAAVSGPGAMSARTDGGPGNQRQPIRVPTGGRYGERKAATEQQQAAPMVSGGPVTPTAAPAAGGGTLAPPPAAGAFGPTQRPNEPNNLTTLGGMNPTAQNPQAALRVIYSKFQHPAIARLIDWSATGRVPHQ